MSIACRIKWFDLGANGKRAGAGASAQDCPNRFHDRQNAPPLARPFNGAQVGGRMRKLLLMLSVASTLALAGCTGTTETDAPSESYSVPVTAAHAINGDDRTIRVVVSQGGTELKSGTYSTAGKIADDFETLFTVNAAAGPLKLQAFEGTNPLNFKSIDPARCTDPDFQVHVVDGAVHLWSNCD